MDNANSETQIIIRATFEDFNDWFKQYLWTNKLLAQGMPLQVINSLDHLHIQYNSPTGGLIGINVQIIDENTIRLYSFEAVKSLANGNGDLVSENDNSESIRSHFNNLISRIQSHWTKKKPAKKPGVRKNLNVSINRSDTYYHLIALCQNDDLFSISDYRKNFKEQDYERIVISDAKTVTKQGDVRGAVIGTLRLLPNGNKTTIMFVDKDAIWNNPIPEGGYLLFGKFIRRATKHFKDLNVLTDDFKTSMVSQKVKDGHQKDTQDIQKLRVFICYASQDKDVVDELYQRLINEGWIDAWIDKEKLLPGQTWEIEIEKAVESADAVIVCLSRNSVSKEGYIQKEIKKVLDVSEQKPEETIFVIPVRLDECEPPKRLQSWQYTDYFPQNARNKSYVSVLTSLKARAYGIGINIDSIKKVSFGWEQHPEILRPIISRIASGTSLVVVGETNINNETLLHHIFSNESTMELLKETEHRFLFQHIDIPTFGTSIAKDKFWQLAIEPITKLHDNELSKLCQACEDEKYKLRDLEKLFDYLSKLKIRLAVFVERFDLLVALSIPERTEFYAGLRFLASMSDSLVLIYSSRQSVSDFHFVTSNLMPHGSPFFNNMLEFKIPPLD